MIGFYNYTVVPTYMSLLSSVFGIYFAVTNKPLYAIYCLMVSGVLDAFDGKIARTRKRTEQEKRFGIQIDSLCDLVCFGVLPAVIGYSIGMNKSYFMLILAVYIIAAITRLAYFNVMEEERQCLTDEVRKTYQGLPVTATALIFPIIFCLKYLCGNAFVAIYTVSMIIIAAAFVVDFKVEKPGLRGILLLIGLGIIEFVVVIVVSVNYGA